MNEFFTSLADPVVILGLVASIIVLVSMCFNASTKRGNLLMRLVNLVGSLISVIYGLLLGPAGYGTILLNGVLVFVNAIYITRAVRDK